MKNIIKLHAAFKAGCLGENLFDTYFSFFANIIQNNNIKIINEIEIAKRFEDEYEINLPIPFVKQVLSVGIQNGCFIEDYGRYRVSEDVIARFRFETSSFDAYWGMLKKEFLDYCNQLNIEMENIDVEEYILNLLDDTDDLIISFFETDMEKMDEKQYAWYDFVKSQEEKGSELYTFIVAISASNIIREALFFTSDTRPDYSGLHIYLDSPIIFALLEMDEESRTRAYRILIKNMLEVGCSIQILDHNFQEIEGILARAAGWAVSTEYDIRKANNATRFFHDSGMTQEEIMEYCGALEKKLSDYNISVKNTNYDVYQNQFQEDEKLLFDMIQQKYSEHGYELSLEKEQTIRTDVRSIIMIYRERQGQTAVRIHKAKHLMLTSNNTIANVSKLYESNKSVNAGHIPACISADIFGAVLWLNSPLEMMEYQKQKLLADCYSFLRPNQKLLDKYIQSLDDARNADEIDEKTFLFLRSHKVVLSSLMNVTKGDYARFNSNTYREVYQDIEFRALKKYRDENEAHQKTLAYMEEFQQKTIEEKKAYEEQITKFREALEREKEHEERVLKKNTKLIAYMLTFILFGIPYVVIYVGIEFLKVWHMPVVAEGEGSWDSIIKISIVVLVTIINKIMFNKGKQWCFNYAEKYLRSRK